MKDYKFNVQDYLDEEWIGEETFLLEEFFGFFPDDELEMSIFTPRPPFPR